MKILKHYSLAIAACAVAALLSCGKGQPKEGDTETVDVDGITIEFAYVEPGTFQMGGTPEQEKVDVKLEKPVHEVKITKGYYIAKLEVTQELYQKVMGKNPSVMKLYEAKENNQLPVNNITWAEAKEFAKKLAEKTGKKIRLLTEAEWEYAAREAKKHVEGMQYCGSKYIDRIACFRDNSNNTPHPVGLFMPTKLDVRDMSGNVAEWVEDNYNLYRDSVYTDPCIVTSPNDAHITRGGSYSCLASKCRTATRDPHDANYSSSEIGVRLAMDYTPEE